MIRILVVDNEPESLRNCQDLLLDAGFRGKFTNSGQTALQLMKRDRPDLVILDLDLPESNGLETLKALKKTDPSLQIIVTTASASTEDAIEATKAGAFDYVLKPFDKKEMLGLIGQALEAGRFMRSPVEMDLEAGHGDGDALVGRSRPMREVYKTIGRAAPTDATVLIQGESGTGKELVARAIYQHSQRSHLPFVVINCVAIPENLLESELFGYEKGSFTGAERRKIGKVEQAQGGTVFLDEIGDMPQGTQAKLLRLLQERSIERIGGQNPIEVDVRIVSATNRNLGEAVTRGLFREDLYYRLNVVPLLLPPLRERPEDIPLLCEYFLGRITRELGVRNPGITPQALEILKMHPWPGNVRELANAMEKCLIFGQGRPVGTDEVNQLVLGLSEHRVGPRSQAEEAIRSWARHNMAQGLNKMLSRMNSQVERLIIQEALNTTRGNHSRAAKLLGVSRPTLLSRLDKYGLRNQAD